MLELIESQDFVREVEKRLSDSIALSNPERGGVLLDVARHLCLAEGAKRSRPRLVLLFGKAVGAPAEALYDIGVSSELVHAASLLHDDVIDEGSVRRGRETANTVYGNLAAVLAGDLVLARAIHGLMRWPLQVSDGALSVVVEMSEAAIVEAERRLSTDVTIEIWKRIAEGKTGALLGWCGAAAAWAAGDSEAAERFERCGRHLGLAYQLADDIWDFEGLKGKDPLQDLRHGNPSYVLAHAMERSPAIGRQLGAFWEAGSPDDQVEAMAQHIVDAGGLVAAREAVNEAVAAAIDALGAYSQRSGGGEIELWARMLGSSFQGAAK